MSTKTEKPLVFFTKTENQMLKNEKSANRIEHENRKTDQKNIQNRKTENPNAPLLERSRARIVSLHVVCNDVICFHPAKKSHSSRDFFAECNQSEKPVQRKPHNVQNNERSDMQE